MLVHNVGVVRLQRVFLVDFPVALHWNASHLRRDQVRQPITLDHLLHAPQARRQGLRVLIEIDEDQAFENLVAD